LSSDGVPGPQDVEPLTPGRGPNEHASDAPEATQKGSVDEVSRIDKEDVTIPRDGFIEDRLELMIQENLLNLDVLAQRLLGGTGTARVRCQVKPRPARNFRVWVSPRRIPVSSKMRSTASAVVRTG